MRATTEMYAATAPDHPSPDHPSPDHPSPADAGPDDPTTGRVDVHAHYFPPEYRTALDAAGISAAGGFAVPAWTPELALDFMDRHGIAAQVVSVSDPGLTFADRAGARALARSCNAYGAELVRRHPARFGALALLPLPDVAGAVDEIAHALDALRLDGVAILSSYDVDGDRTYPGDPALDPVLAALDARGAYAMIHPTAPPPDDRPQMHGIPPAGLEFTFETTRAAANLIWTGALDRFPRIRWSLSHAGGTLPFVGYRIVGLFDVLAGRQVTGRDASPALLGRFLYDTALNPTRAAMGAVREVAGVGAVLFGSDFPFVDAMYPHEGDTQPELADSFGAAELRAVGRANALAQFPRLAAAVQRPVR